MKKLVLILTIIFFSTYLFASDEKQGRFFQDQPDITDDYQIHFIYLLAKKTKDKERKIIETAMINLGAERKEVKNIITEAENIESNSNQILDFTKKVKTMKDEYKFQIIEALWKIIYFCIV